MTKIIPEQNYCKKYKLCAQGDTCAQAYTPEVKAQFERECKFAKFYNGAPSLCFMPKEKK